MKIGQSAVGIVFERLIQKLSALHEVDVLTADYEPSLDLSSVSEIIFSKKINLHQRAKVFFISLLGVDPTDRLWAWKSKRLIDAKKGDDYDIILSFLSFQYYATAIAGSFIAKNSSAKFAIHSLDAIPAPGGWLKNGRYYRSLKKMMAKYLKNADAFFATNQQMLEYQLNTFTAKKHLITNVIYNPGQEKVKDLALPASGINNFVYTGGIYGLRKSIYILKAFEKLLEIYPESKLIFVGTQLPTNSLTVIKPETQAKIEIVPFTLDLDPYYQCATALIDIDADIENDVFMSSKVTTYVMINRIIICETSTNSPAWHLFKNIDSIILSNHDSDDFCEAMKKSIVINKSVSFTDREEIRTQFQLENIVYKLNNSLKKIIA